MSLNWLYLLIDRKSGALHSNVCKVRHLQTLKKLRKSGFSHILVYKGLSRSAPSFIRMETICRGVAADKTRSLQTVEEEPSKAYTWSVCGGEGN